MVNPGVLIVLRDIRAIFVIGKKIILVYISATDST